MMHRGNLISSSRRGKSNADIQVTLRMIVVERENRRMQRNADLYRMEAVTIQIKCIRLKTRHTNSKEDRSQIQL